MGRGAGQEKFRSDKGFLRHIFKSPRCFSFGLFFVILVFIALKKIKNKKK
jgi:hypothetical protein